MRYQIQAFVLRFIDLGIAAFSLYAALGLRYGTVALPSDAASIFASTLPWLLVGRSAALHLLGIYRIAARHTGLRDVQVIGAATVVGSAAFATYLAVGGPADFPRSAVIIEWLVNYVAVAGIRVAYRICVDEWPAGWLSGSRPRQRRLLIIGAGSRGASLAREIRRRAGANITLVGLLDDDPRKWRSTVHGAAVLGPCKDLRAIVAERNVDEVILAIPSATGSQVRQIVSLCEHLPVQLRVSPGFSELDEGDELRTIRDISIEDLLRRPPVSVDVEEIAAYLRGRRVLVTGAGGSIGSQLVRQIAAVNPAEIILLGHGENSIFEIQQELIRKHGLRPTAVIADVRDFGRLLGIFESLRPEVVFHAAAHKHVPLMEGDVVEAVTNNVLGTRNVCRAASRVRVERFVMISTDKAVRPTSVMGATKRAAEIVVRLESMSSDTEFATVRFGNVLGSRGSVIPVMRKQIEAGGPVTVTHEEVTRYFMTIPEAAQLVIQAGAMAEGNGVYLLDMGEPVRILDLARDLIRLSGLVPGKDIRIEIVGLRPGEKLFEELLTEEEGAAVTRHKRIFAAPPQNLDAVRYRDLIDRLIDRALNGDALNCMKILHELEPTYGRPAAPEAHAVVGSDSRVASIAHPAAQEYA